MNKQKELGIRLLALTGVEVNGKNPWDIQVHNDKFYSRVFSQGSLGLGESYVDGWWDCEALDEFFCKALSAKLEGKIRFNLVILKAFLEAKLFNLQTKEGSKKVAELHYNLSTDLYMSFLDPYNQYTCGYFKDTTSLNIAQEQKLDLICRKLLLTKQDRVLDIGCGWGGFAKYAAEKYGCHVTGISISSEQVAYAQKFTQGLPVSIKNLDYRELVGQYDKVLICGMIEHVGYKNYKKLFEKVKQCLAPDGLFLLHTIGGNTSVTAAEPWIRKYIFPNSMLPSLKQLTGSSEGLFVMEDLHNFGAYYDSTLMAWFNNFNNSWPKLKENYDERFYRIWRYYLLACAGMFRSRDCQLWQMVLSPNGVKGGYKSIR